MRRLISCSALVIACLTLSGCWLEDDDPEGNNVDQIVDTPQSDDTTGDDDNADSGENSDTDDNTRSDDTANDDSTGSDDTTGDDDSTDSGDPVYVGNPTGSGDTDDTDDSTDSDDNSDTNDNTRSGGTVDTDDTTGSDDTADTDDTTDSDDTADTDDPADSDDTADNDEPTDSDDTADTDDPTDSDDSTDSDDTTTITKYQWRSPVSLYDAKTPPAISTHDDQVVTTWYQDLEIWASVGTVDNMENAQLFNVSKSGKVYSRYSNDRDNYARNKQIRPSVSNGKGETCTAWGESSSTTSIRVACYSSTSGAWSDPLTVYEGFDYFKQFEMVALSDDRFALVFNHQVYRSNVYKIELAIFTPTEVQQQSTIESDPNIASSQITITPNDSAGFNLLYTSVNPDNTRYNRLLLLKIDDELSLDKTMLDELYTNKSQLLLTSGDNPAVSYVSTGNVTEMFILDRTLTEVDIGDVRLNPGYYHSLVSTSDGTLYFAWQASDAKIRHIIVKDGEATLDTSLVELNIYTPQLIVDEDKIYMTWIQNVNVEGYYRYALHFSHYVDGAWTEPSRLTCTELQGCVSAPSNTSVYQYAVTDEMITIAYQDAEGGKIITTAKEEAVEEEE